MPVPGRHLILETTFETAQGSAMLIDFMLIPKREDRVDLVHGRKEVHQELSTRPAAPWRPSGRRYDKSDFSSRIHL